MAEGGGSAVVGGVAEGGGAEDDGEGEGITVPVWRESNPRGLAVLGSEEKDYSVNISLSAHTHTHTHTPDPPSATPGDDCSSSSSKT